MNLFDIFVTFGAKGVDVLEAAFESVRRKSIASSLAMQQSFDVAKGSAVSLGAALLAQKRATAANQLVNTLYQLKQAGGALGAIAQSMIGPATRAWAQLADQQKEATEYAMHTMLVLGGNARSQKHTAESALAASQSLTAQLRIQQERWDKINAASRQAGVAIGIASGAMSLFVANSIRMSFLGDLLSFQFARIGRSLGGLLTPEIISLVRWMDQMALKLESMTDAQRRQASFNIQAAATFNVMRITLAALGPLVSPLVGLFIALGAAGVVADHGIKGFLQDLQPLFQGVMSVIRPFWEIFLALVAGFTSKWFIIIAGAIAVIYLFSKWKLLLEDIRVLFNILGAHPFIRSIMLLALIIGGLTRIFSKKQDEGGRGTLAPTMGGFEQSEGAWQRIMLASRKVGAGGKPIDEQQLEELRGINQGVKQIDAGVRGIKPAVKV